MVRIIRNNFRLHAFWFALLYAMLAVLGIVVMNEQRGAYSGLVLGAGMGNLMVVAFLVREAYYQGYLLGRTLPVDIPTSVAATYLTVVILCFVSTASGHLFHLLFHLVSNTPIAWNQIDVGYGAVHSLIVRLVSWWILLAAGIPFIIRYGTAIRIVVWYFLAGTIHTIAINPLLMLSAAGSSAFGLNGWVFIVTMTFGVVSLLSFNLSVWLLRRKEF